MLPKFELARLRDQGLFRSLYPLTGIDFASNDFLGLANSAKVRTALTEYLQGDNPIGSTGSRLVSGETDFLHESEENLARIFQSPAALFFGSGYLANLGITGALGGPDTQFFSDEYNHASLVDGLRLTKSKIEIFRHNDLEHLRSSLLASSAPRKIVVTESIFSMDGDGPDLKALKGILNESDAFLILDEAHATGIMGARGLGCAEDIGFNSETTVIVHTCGKALGSYGAFVSCSKELRDLMINKARSFIYSTGPAPLQIAQTMAALHQIQTEPELRGSLKRNIVAFQRKMAGIGIHSPASHIIPILIPGNEALLRAARTLEAFGLAVKGIRFPSIPAGQERIRVTLKSFHSESDLELFASALKEALR